MKSRNGETLRWKKPPRWEEFVDAVAAEHRGCTSPYVGIAIEQAWDEYHEEHAVEELTEDLRRAVGLPHNGREERSPSSRTVCNPDGEVNVRVLTEIKEEMRAYAKELKVPAHEVLRAVVNWYLEGGLLGRVTDHLERTVPEVEDQAAELFPSAGENTGLTEKDKKRRWIAEHLPDEFTLKEFGDVLETMPYRGGDTEHMRDEHLDPVLERLDYVVHPNHSDRPDNKTIYIPERRAREIRSDESKEAHEEAESRVTEVFDSFDGASMADDQA